MINVLLLLYGLLSPFAGETTVAVEPPSQPTAELALWQHPFPAQAAENGRETRRTMGAFDSMGGISLYDDLKSVLSKKGEPDSVEKDPYTGYIECQYGNLTVGLYEDLVYYVHTGFAPQNISVNDISIPLQEPWLSHFFGEPDFVAEDGDVYIRGSAALKIYKDPAGKIIGVDLFDEAAS